MGDKRAWLKWNFIKEIIKKLEADDISGLAAQLAYFFLLSMFPLFIFLFTLVAYLTLLSRRNSTYVANFCSSGINGFN